MRELLYKKQRYRNVQWLRGGLVFQAHRLLYHSALGVRVIKKNKELFAAGLRKSGGLVRILLPLLVFYYLRSPFFIAGRREAFSTVTQVNRGCTFALGRSTLDFLSRWAAPFGAGCLKSSVRVRTGVSRS